MDVATERDLFDFLDSLDKDEEDAVAGTSPPPPTRVSTAVDEERETVVWSDIADALNNWTQRVLDAESRYTTSRNFHQLIEESIRRQQLDGFLSNHDITELRYITDVWVKLLNALSSYSIGCEFVKRDIITLLLELFTWKQISSSLFIETCLKL